MLGDRLPSGVLRWVLKAPRWLYRAHLGRVLGRRFLLLTYRGQVTGRRRQAVLEVIHFEPSTGESVVLSGWGERAQWYRGLQAAPAEAVETGGRRYVPRHRFVGPEELYRDMQGYLRRNRWATGAVMRLLGPRFDGSEGDRARAQSLRGVAFRPMQAEPAAAAAAQEKAEPEAR
jgi:deazaflavin-dependent oxidoreductase (nitroreductase family)